MQQNAVTTHVLFQEALRSLEEEVGNREDELNGSLSSLSGSKEEIEKRLVPVKVCMSKIFGSFEIGSLMDTSVTHKRSHSHLFRTQRLSYLQNKKRGKY